MIPIIIVLILASLLQTTLLPVDSVLLILIARSFIVDEKNNLWLAFWFGLLVALLTGLSLGVLSLVYMAMVILAGIIKRTQFASNPLIIFPLTIILVTFTQLLENLFFGIKLNLSLIFLQTTLMLPIYLILQCWEERFIPRKEIK